MRPRRGMTMIELVVVIALMAIIAGVAAPALASLDPKTSSSGLDAVETLLRRSRATAIRRSIEINMTIDPASARYWIEPMGTGVVLALPAQASLSARAARVHFRFEPNGQTVADEPLFVREGGNARAVVIDAWTGEVLRARH